jgi:hypothetical protein
MWQPYMAAECLQLVKACTVEARVLLLLLLVAVLLLL